MTIICAICHDGLTEASEDRTVVVSLRCGHLFHHACVDRWLMNSPTCPCCNSNCASSPPLRVYPVEEEEEPAPGGERNAELKQLTEVLNDTLARNNELNEKMEEKTKENERMQEVMIKMICKRDVTEEHFRAEIEKSHRAYANLTKDVQKWEEDRISEVQQLTEKLNKALARHSELNEKEEEKTKRLAELSKENGQMKEAMAEITCKVKITEEHLRAEIDKLRRANAQLTEKNEKLTAEQEPAHKLAELVETLNLQTTPRNQADDGHAAGAALPSAAASIGLADNVRDNQSDIREQSVETAARPTRARSPVQTRAVASSVPLTGWHCASCTFKNGPHDQVCGGCKRTKGWRRQCRKKEASVPASGPTPAAPEAPLNQD